MKFIYKQRRFWQNGENKNLSRCVELLSPLKLRARKPNWVSDIKDVFCSWHQILQSCSVTKTSSLYSVLFRQEFIYCMYSYLRLLNKLGRFGIGMYTCDIIVVISYLCYHNCDIVIVISLRFEYYYYYYYCKWVFIRWHKWNKCT